MARKRRDYMGRSKLREAQFNELEARYSSVQDYVVIVRYRTGPNNAQISESIPIACFPDAEELKKEASRAAAERCKEKGGLLLAIEVTQNKKIIYQWKKELSDRA